MSLVDIVYEVRHSSHVDQNGVLGSNYLVDIPAFEGEGFSYGNNYEHANTIPEVARLIVTDYVQKVNDERIKQPPLNRPNLVVRNHPCGSSQTTLVAEAIFEFGYHNVSRSSSPLDRDDFLFLYSTVYTLLREALPEPYVRA